MFLLSVEILFFLVKFMGKKVCQHGLKCPNSMRFCWGVGIFPLFWLTTVLIPILWAARIQQKFLIVSIMVNLKPVVYICYAITQFDWLCDRQFCKFAYIYMRHHYVNECRSSFKAFFMLLYIWQICWCILFHDWTFQGLWLCMYVSMANFVMNKCNCIQ